MPPIKKKRAHLLVDPDFPEPEVGRESLPCEIKMLCLVLKETRALKCLRETAISYFLNGAFFEGFTKRRMKLHIASVLLAGHMKAETTRF